MSNLSRMNFDSKPSPERHPERLAVVGKLRGLAGVAPTHARVLELGCGAGTHLAALALTLPQSTFLGVDIDAEAIAAGQEIIRQLKLANLTLKVHDLKSFTPPRTSFDYIICHGVFSWVEPSIQEAIFSICKEALSDNGVLGISYNSLPGWHTRSVLHKALTYFDQPGNSSSERVQSARQLFDVLENELRDDPSPHATALREETSNCKQQPDHFILRELLAEHVAAFHFSEFVDLAEKFGLQYLGDGRLSRMYPRRSPEVLPQSNQPLLQAEQFMDFLVPSPFRFTLLCRSEHKLQSVPEPKALERLYVSSRLVALSPTPDLRSESLEPFCDPRGYVLEITDPATKQMLSELASAWPKALPIKHQHLETLLTYAQQNLVDLHIEPIRCQTTVSEKPIAHPLARLQADNGSYWVINYRHEFSILDEYERQLIPLLDGKRTLKELGTTMLKNMSAGELAVQVEGKEISGTKALSELVNQKLAQSLQRFASEALLMLP